MTSHPISFINLFLFLPLIFSCTSENRRSFDYSIAKKLENHGWQEHETILSRIVPPKFPDQRILISEFGGVGDSITDNHDAFQKAMDHLKKQGGGILMVPPGQYYVDGPIHLRNNVNLHVQDGARIFFSSNPASYLPAVKVRWEGTVCYNYSPLLYGYQLENVGITGKGVIDGAGKTWSMEWREIQKPDKDRLRKMGNDRVPEVHRVFANGFLDLDGDGKDDGHGDGNLHYLRPSLIQLYECKNVLIEDLTVRESPFWTIHPVFSKNVTVRNLKVYGEVVNDDGVDPDSSEDVLVEGCEIKTHDDAIAIKAGRDQDAWERDGCRNIIIRNNSLMSGVNAIGIGSEMSGGVENVFVYDNFISNGKHALNFKCNLDRGGQVQKVYIKNIDIESCREAMFIFRMDYHGYRGNHFPTKFNDFFVSGIHCKEVMQKPFKIVGVEEEPIARVFLDNVVVDHAGERSEIRFAKDLVFNDVKVGGKTFEFRNTEPQ